MKRAFAVLLETDSYVNQASHRRDRMHVLRTGLTLNMTIWPPQSKARYDGMSRLSISQLSILGQVKTAVSINYARTQWKPGLFNPCFIDLTLEVMNYFEEN